MRFIIIQTSTTTREDAERLIRLLLEKRQAACANIIKNELSFYEWEGKACSEQEYIVTIKTRAALYEAVEKTLKENHPYDTPMIIAWDITHIDAKYAAWVEAQTQA